LADERRKVGSMLHDCVSQLSMCPFVATILFQLFYT
jgi:hypothetical protein